MSSMKRVIKYQNLELKKSVVWFWSTLLIINIISYTLNLNYIYGNGFFGVSTENNNVNLSLRIVSVAAANLMPIVIYFIACGYERYYQSFPISISFSVTRREFYKSVIINNLLISFMFALIQSILMKLDIYIMKTLDKNPMLDFGIFNTETDNIIYMIFALGICFLAVLSTINLLGALNYKFGFKLWIFLGILFTLSTAFFGLSNLGMFDTLFTTRISVVQLIKFGAIIMFSYSIGYIIVSNMNIKDKIS